jgi:hypothetical protein
VTDAGRSTILNAARGHGSPAEVVAVEGMADEAIRAAFPWEKLGKMSGYTKWE